MVKLNSAALLVSTVMVNLNGNVSQEQNAWGSLKYSALSHLNVVFDQEELAKIKQQKPKDVFYIPNAVTHVNLKLEGNYKEVVLPETVQFINKDIFEKSIIGKIYVPDNVIKNILGKNYGDNNAEKIQEYFSLHNNTEISIIGEQNKSADISKHPTLDIQDKKINVSFQDEIKNFNPNKLRHHDGTKNDAKASNATTGLLDEIRNFDSNTLKHTSENKSPKTSPNRSFLNDIGEGNFKLNHVEPNTIVKPTASEETDLTSLLRKQMDKRRQAIAPDEDENEPEDETNWDD